MRTRSRQLLPIHMHTFTSSPRATNQNLQLEDLTHDLYISINTQRTISAQHHCVPLSAHHKIKGVATYHTTTTPSCNIFDTCDFRFTTHRSCAPSSAHFSQPYSKQQQVDVHSTRALSACTQIRALRPQTNEVHLGTFNPLPLNMSSPFSKIPLIYRACK